VCLRREHAAAESADFELVARADPEPRDEHLPDAGLVAPPHWVAAAVPGVEVADHRDALSVGRPHGEAYAAHAVDCHRLRAEGFGEPPVFALGDQMEVELAEQQTKGIRILGLLGCTRPLDAQPVW